VIPFDEQISDSINSDNPKPTGQCCHLFIFEGLIDEYGHYRNAEHENRIDYPSFHQSDFGTNWDGSSSSTKVTTAPA
jgi:hypothetical protein